MAEALGLIDTPVKSFGQNGFLEILPCIGFRQIGTRTVGPWTIGPQTVEPLYTRLGSLKYDNLCVFFPSIVPMKVSIKK